MFNIESISNLKIVVATFYIGIFCYIVYICIPIQCPPNDFEESSQKPELLYEENISSNNYGLNFELEYEIRLNNIYNFNKSLQYRF